ncbi:winged helix-turn-helix transcriptional regulator [Actinoplanes sp. NPDC051494]|uniref:winged helix-turn-helix transcriptional regulator n=1 Tax=Actinoplanes sp. NPDC051494 TaxID=3363907 RepID=UPI003788F864
MTATGETPPATGNTRWSRTNRELRRGLVVATLEALQRRGELTIRELAPAVGMSIVTANKLLRELTETGTVRTVTRRPTVRGPKPRLFRLPPTRFVTVHVAGGSITAVAGGFEGDGTAVTAPGGAGPAQLADLVVRATAAPAMDGGPGSGSTGLNSAGSGSAGSWARHPPAAGRAGAAGRPVRGPGPGSRTAGLSGVVIGTPPGTGPPARELRDRLDAPVRVHSNAYLAAIAEARIGAGRGHPAFVLVAADPETTVTLVRDGRPHEGAHRAAGVLDRYLAHLDLAHLDLDRVPPPVRRVAGAVVLACLIADPELVVLAPDLGAGPEAVRAAVTGLVLSAPRIVAGAVPGDPVLAGARLLASAAAIDDLADRAVGRAGPRADVPGPVNGHPGAPGIRQNHDRR